jgi:hypothetical protein
MRADGDHSQRVDPGRAARLMICRHRFLTCLTTEGLLAVSSGQRIKVEHALFNEIATPATERVMTDFPYASTKAPMRFRVSFVVAALALSGCNANQEVNPSSQPPSQVFAGHYEDYNPYDPISYAQNNTGRGGGR